MKDLKLIMIENLILIYIYFNFDKIVLLFDLYILYFPFFLIIFDKKTLKKLIKILKNKINEILFFITNNNIYKYIKEKI